MKSAMIYVRELAGTSLDAQVEQCRRYAAARDLVVGAAVVDFELPVPAYRLGLRGALDMVSAGDVAVLITPSPEHLSTNPLRLESLRAMLSEKNCDIQYVNGG
jgi:hypothetical protein